MVGVDPGKRSSGIALVALPYPFGPVKLLLALDCPSHGREIEALFDEVVRLAELELAAGAAPAVVKAEIGLAVELQWSGDPTDAAHGSKVAGSLGCAAARGRFAGEAERRGWSVTECQPGEWRRGLGLAANTRRGEAKAAAISSMRARLAAGPFKVKVLTDHVAEAFALGEFVAVEQRNNRARNAPAR